ncbi:unnamed protein product [Spodoptera exigua]|nr:unnamed protein product [Spodoptera exigua]
MSMRKVSGKLVAVEDLQRSQLFTRLKKTDPESFKKLVPISGDIRLPKLGLKPEDEQTLIDNVSVVYHGAATVKFTEPLAIAMNTNFESTKKLLELSQRMKNIEVFLYISTAFTHTQKKVLVETVYPPPAKVEDIYKFIEEYGDDEQATLKFIISATKQEPIPGWLDNWYGSTPFLMNASEGWLRIVRGNYNSGIDFIPVDFVTNLSIVAAAKAKRYVKILAQVIRLRDAYEHFSSNAWIMRSDRTRQLHASLSPEDQEKFKCDPTQINWPEYLKDYCRGVLKYLKPRKMY